MVQKLLYRVKDLLEILNSIEKEIEELNSIQNSMLSDRSYFPSIRDSLLREIEILETKKQELLNVKVSLKSIQTDLEKKGINVHSPNIYKSSPTEDIIIDNPDLERTLEKIQSTRKERKVYRY